MMTYESLFESPNRFDKCIDFLDAQFGSADEVRYRLEVLVI
jgi:hypothetical protein